VSYIVTISGDLASGKTSVATGLSAKLGFGHISVGKIYREIADGLGMNSLEFNLYAEWTPEIDKRVDSIVIGLVSDRRDYVVESRTAWHQLEGSLKVYLKVDPDVGAERVRGDMNRRNEPLYANHEDAKAQLRARKESENRRILAEYGVDCEDLLNYDVVIESTTLTIDQIVDQLVSIVNQWREKTPGTSG
jgi:cytidylate kinase